MGFIQDPKENYEDLEQIVKETIFEFHSLESILGINTAVSFCPFIPNCQRKTLQIFNF